MIPATENMKKLADFIVRGYELPHVASARNIFLKEENFKLYACPLTAAGLALDRPGIVEKFNELGQDDMSMDFWEKLRGTIESAGIDLEEKVRHPERGDDDLWELGGLVIDLIDDCGWTATNLVMWLYGEMEDE